MSQRMMVLANSAMRGYNITYDEGGLVVTTTEKGIRYPYLRLARLSPRRVMLTPA